MQVISHFGVLSALDGDTHSIMMTAAKIDRCKIIELDERAHLGRDRCCE